jgi:transposase
VLRELSKVEQRYDAVMGVIKDGLAVTEVAEKFGVTRQSLHAWLRRYETGGIEALADRSHRPKSVPHQIDGAAEARVLELRRLHPFWGQRTIAHRLAKEGYSPAPSESGVYRSGGDPHRQWSRILRPALGQRLGGALRQDLPGERHHP